jgi:CRP/FNR family transcriptional regulator
VSVFFSRLDAGESDALRRIAVFRHLRAKAIVFSEGDDATGFFLLLRGLVRIFKASADGKEYTLHVVRPGQVFAEAAIFSGGGYPATCVTLEDSWLAFFPKREFTALLEAYPHIALKIIASLSSWLREFSHKLEDLSLRDVPARVAGYLLQESAKRGRSSFALDHTKRQLASRVGTISETLSRSLRRLCDAGVIAVSGRRFSILDPDRLQAIADGGKIESATRASGPSK